jgi:hypothetical protein
VEGVLDKSSDVKIDVIDTSSYKLASTVQYWALGQDESPGVAGETLGMI